MLHDIDSFETQRLEQVDRAWDSLIDKDGYLADSQGLLYHIAREESINGARLDMIRFELNNINSTLKNISDQLSLATTLQALEKTKVPDWDSITAMKGALQQICDNLSGH
jgi:hypothetical protein